VHKKPAQVNPHYGLPIIMNVEAV